jgi:hypothetical protein
LFDPDTLAVSIYEPDFITYDEASKIISIKTTNTALIDEVNPYIIRIRCTIVEYPESFLHLIDPEPEYADTDPDYIKRVKSPAYNSDFELIISANPPPRNVTDPPEFTSDL